MKTKILLTLAVIVFTGSSLFAQRTFNSANVKTYTGTITNVDHPVAYFTSDDGTKYEVRMGPYWFWNQNGYKLEANTAATIKGETGIDNGVNEIYPWDIIQGSKTIKLVDDNGYPKWSIGDGNKNCNGWGKGNCGKNNK